MKKAGKAGTYDSWLFEESDLIQHAAKSFADALIADRYAEVLKTCDADLQESFGAIKLSPTLVR